MRKTTALRRDFLKAASVATGSLTILGASSKASGRTFKVGLIGCGGRARYRRAFGSDTKLREKKQ